MLRGRPSGEQRVADGSQNVRADLEVATHDRGFRRFRMLPDKSPAITPQREKAEAQTLGLPNQQAESFSFDRMLPVERGEQVLRGGSLFTRRRNLGHFEGRGGCTREFEIEVEDGAASRGVSPERPG